MYKNDLTICLDLQSKLSERIKGDIFIKISEMNFNTVVVNIRAARGVAYKHHVNHISNKTISDIADEIERDYREFINYTFFNNKFFGWG